MNNQPRDYTISTGRIKAFGGKDGIDVFRRDTYKRSNFIHHKDVVYVVVQPRHE